MSYPVKNYSAEQVPDEPQGASLPVLERLAKMEEAQRELARRLTDQEESVRKLYEVLGIPFPGVPF